MEPVWEFYTFALWDFPAVFFCRHPIHQQLYATFLAVRYQPVLQMGQAAPRLSEYILFTVAVRRTKLSGRRYRACTQRVLLRRLLWQAEQGDQRRYHQHGAAATPIRT